MLIPVYVRHCCLVRLNELQTAQLTQSFQETPIDKERIKNEIQRIKFWSISNGAWVMYIAICLINDVCLLTATSFTNQEKLANTGADPYGAVLTVIFLL